MVFPMCSNKIALGHKDRVDHLVRSYVLYKDWLGVSARYDLKHGLRDMFTLFQASEVALGFDFSVCFCPEGPESALGINVLHYSISIKTFR